MGLLLLSVELARRVARTFVCALVIASLAEALEPRLRLFLGFGRLLNDPVYLGVLEDGDLGVRSVGGRAAEEGKDVEESTRGAAPFG